MTSLAIGRELNESRILVNFTTKTSAHMTVIQFVRAYPFRDNLHQADTYACHSVWLLICVVFQETLPTLCYLQLEFGRNSMETHQFYEFD